MSFLDELDDDTPCLASFCPQCKDNPEAIEMRKREAEGSRIRMTAPLRFVLKDISRAQPEQRDTTEWMRK